MPTPAFFGLPHSESEVYFVKSSTIGWLAFLTKSPQARIQWLKQPCDSESFQTSTATGIR